MSTLTLTQSSANAGMPRLMRVRNAQGWKLWVNLSQIQWLRTISPTQVEAKVNDHLITVSGDDAKVLRAALDRNHIVDVQGEWV